MDDPQLASCKGQNKDESQYEVDFHLNKYTTKEIKINFYPTLTEALFSK